MEGREQVDNIEKYESKNVVIRESNNGINTKEYLLSIPKENSYAEIYDFDNNLIYDKTLKNFSLLKTVDSFRHEAIPLKSNNNEYNYLFCFIGQENGQSSSDYNFILQKHKFTSVQNFVNESTMNNTLVISDINAYFHYSGVSCFQTLKKYIMCFFLTKDKKYIIIVFDENLNELKRSIIDELSFNVENPFYKSIHLKEEIGIFAYYKTSTHLSIKFQEYIPNEIEIKNFSISNITVDSITFDSYILGCDIMMLSDEKISLCSYKDNQFLIIILINLFEDKFYKIRYYSLNVKAQINIKVYSYVQTHNFNNLLVLGFNYNGDQGLGGVDKLSSCILIFSYPNSSDYYLYLDNYLNNFTYYNNITINLTNEVRIENNIFGYVFSGIKIHDLFNCDNLIFYSCANKNAIYFNYTLEKNELISLELIVKNATNFNNFTCILQYRYIVTEPDLEEKDKYANITVDNFPQNYHPISEKEKYIGRLTYYNIILNEYLTTECYDINCALCFDKNISYCIICKYNYTYFEDGTKNCSGVMQNEYTSDSIYSSYLDRSEYSNHLEKDEFSEYSSYLDLQKNNCYEYCEIIELFKKKNILIFANKSLQQELTNEIDFSIVSHSIDTLLIDLMKNNSDDLEINFMNIKYHINTTLNQEKKKYDGISTIDLRECENIIKNKYNITQTQSLIIYKIEILDNSSIPIVFYQIYHPITKQKLNLSYCSGMTIDISYKVNINEKELFKYDPSHKFYSDICFSYTTEFQTDITIKDRQEEYINKNLSLCEEDCNYNNYDINTKKVTCECLIKIYLPIISEIKFNKEKLKSKFKNIQETINLKIMKCHHLIFMKEGIIKNIGSYVLLFIILVFIISAIILPFKSYNVLYMKITNIYDKKNNNKNQSNYRLNKQKNKIINEQITEGNKHKIIRKSKKNSRNKKIINKYKKKSSKIKTSNNSPPKKKKKYSIHSKIIQSFKNNNTNFELDLSENKKIIKQKKYNFLENINDDIGSKNNILLMNYNDNELNTLKYKEALIYDKRSFCQYYISLLKTKHILIFTFFNSKDYNILMIKICLFLFFFALNFTINALFFTGSTIHEIYLYKGEYNFIYELPKIIYSTLIISFVNLIIKYFSLTEKLIINFKNDQLSHDLIIKKEKLIKCLKIRIIFFYIISFLFLIFFWYYLSCFCAVYKNTQIYLIKDTMISFVLSLLYPFGLYLIPGIFRIFSIKGKNKEKKCIYNFSQILQLLL